MGSDCVVPDHCLSFYFTIHTLKQAEERLARMKTYTNQGERSTSKWNRKEENYPNALDDYLQSSRTML